MRVRVADGNARHQERVKSLGDAPRYGVADKPVYGNGHVRSVLLDRPDHQHGGVNAAVLKLQVGVGPIEHVALLQLSLMDSSRSRLYRACEGSVS